MVVRLTCGVKFERDPAILDDMQLIDLIAEADEDVTNVFHNMKEEDEE